MFFYFLLQLIPFVLVFYFYIKRKYSFWSDRKIQGPKPIFPFGYLLNRAINEPPDFEYDLAQKYGRIYGLYTGTLPTLTVNDADIIKNICIKDFQMFLNRRSLNSYHHLWNGNLFNAESESWKRVRTITSPAFTSGALRKMYPLMDRCIMKLVNYLDQQTIGVSGEEAVIDPKAVIIGFTIDVIACTSFATETDTNGDRTNANDPLLKHSETIFAFNGFKIAAVFALPRRVLNLLNITTWFDQNSFDYFINLTKQILQQRKLEEGTSTKRNDFVQLMVDSFVYDDALQNTDYSKLTASANEDFSETKSLETSDSFQPTKHKLSEDDIIAQSILFFAAGFETTASTLTNCLFELAKYPDVQNKLFEELNSNLADFLTDEAMTSQEYFEIVVNGSPYLDATIKETLRRYPPAIRIERRITSEKGYTISGVHLPKDTLIEISAYAVHHDSEYFPEPFVFKPERFLPENRQNLKPYSYIPFGQGPRNCIGMRFAYQEIKLFLAKVIRRYRFSTTPNTPQKLSFKPGSLLLNVKSFPLKVSRR